MDEEGEDLKYEGIPHNIEDNFSNSSRSGLSLWSFDRRWSSTFMVSDETACENLRSSASVHLTRPADAENGLTRVQSSSFCDDEEEEDDGIS